MSAAAFAGPGGWLRCALHAHTTSSDGELPPWALAAHYRRAGYDVLATTDHWVRTEIPPDAAEGLVVVPSAELNARLPDGRDGHVLAFGVDGVPDAREPFSDLAEAVSWVRGHGGVPYLAHPSWSGADPESLAVHGLAGIEVFNAGCELEIGRGDSAAHWDQALATGHPLHAIAADDSHHPGFDSDLAWTWLRSDARSPGAVLTALDSGCFYASAGPSIEDLTVGHDAVEVRCSPCRSVTLVGGPQRGSRVNAGRLGLRLRAEATGLDGEGMITSARLLRPPDALYERLQLEDRHGRRAWTNAL